MYVCSVLHVPCDFIKIVESTIQDFIWNGKKPKIKQSTLIGNYDDGGLKLPDFQSSLKANRAKWAIKLFQPNEKDNENIRLILSKYLYRIGGVDHVKGNFDKQIIPQNIPPFYRDILMIWSEISDNDNAQNDPNKIFNQYLWNNKNIKIGGSSVFYKVFSDLGINRIIDLCDENGSFTWVYVKGKGLQDKDYFKWAGIIYAIPPIWKTKIKGKIDKFLHIKLNMSIDEKT